MEEKRDLYIPIKNAITLGLTALACILMLAAPVVKRSIPSYAIEDGIGGFGLILMLFRGGNATFVSELFSFDYVMPMAALILLFAGVLLVLAAVALLIVYTVRGKDCRIGGWVILGTAAYLVIMYTVLSVAKSITGLDESGLEYPFYRLYEMTPMLLVVIILLAGAGGLGVLLRRKTVKPLLRFLPLYFILALPTLFILVFNLYPMFLQLLLTFKNYGLGESVYTSKWIGFGNFSMLFEDPMMGRIIFNTVWISFLRLLIGLFPPIILSIMLFQVRSNRLRQIIQTIIYTPHFFSWVVVFAITVAFLGNDGIVNNLFIDWGWIDKNKPIEFLTKESAFLPIVLFTSLWKELGWSTILYVAALGSIDGSQYEAASIDGAGPFRKLWHITLPGIMPVAVFLTIMAVGNLLKGAGGEQILLFKNPSTNEVGQVIDTWVYEIGLRGNNFGVASAITLVQSVIGIAMVLGCNVLSKKATGIGMW